MIYDAYRAATRKRFETVSRDLAGIVSPVIHDRLRGGCTRRQALSRDNNTEQRSSSWSAFRRFSRSVAHVLSLSFSKRIIIASTIAWDLVHHRGVPLLSTSRSSSLLRFVARFDPHPSLLRIDGALVEERRVRGMHYWYQLDQSNSWYFVGQRLLCDGKDKGNIIKWSTRSLMKNI